MMTTTTLTEPETQYNQSCTTYKRRATSEWVNKSPRERNLWENLAAIDLASKKCYEIQPKNTNAPPTHNLWLERLWLICTISPALIIQAFWYHFVPKDNYYHTWHPLVTYAYYSFAFVAYTMMLVRHFHYYMDYYGTFDEDKRPRDYVSDIMVTRLVVSVIIYMSARIGGGLFFGGYNRNEPPSLGHTISWKSGMNYGKQTRIFDRLFGTLSERVECVQK